jgi:hypothetical protein
VFLIPPVTIVLAVFPGFLALQANSDWTGLGSPDGVPVRRLSRLGFVR